MASPQKEDGYTAIANEIMEALARYRIPGEQIRCLLYVLRKTYGFRGKKKDRISLSQFAKACEISKQNASRALNGLVKKGVLKKEYHSPVTYEFNKDYEQWKGVSKRSTSTQKGLKGYSKRSNTKTIYTKTTKKHIYHFSKKVPLPKNFNLIPKMKKYVIDKGCGDEDHINLIFEKFCNHAIQNNRKCCDWISAWRNWVLIDKEKHNPNKYIQYEEMPR